MKRSPHNRLMYGLRMIKTWTHLRHYRGHNVHSPFVYGLIRQVILPRRARTPDEEAYRELRGYGLPHRTAVQLLNLKSYCPEHTLRLFPAQEPPRPTPSPAGGRAIECLLHPRRTKNRFDSCRKCVAAHHGTSIDNRRYILLIHDDRLTKKHYKL